MVVGTGQTEPKIVCCIRSIEQELLGIKLLDAVQEHRLGGLQCGGHIFHIPAFHHESFIGECRTVFCKCLLAIDADRLLQSLTTGGDGVLVDTAE